MTTADVDERWATRLHDLAAEEGVPGAALGVWADGQEVAAAAYGVLNAETGVRATADSLFQIGSITKVWTTTMIMQLVGEGRLSLDTTVAEVLPGVRIGHEDASEQIAIRHLLSHTSGIDGDIFTDTGRGDGCGVLVLQQRLRPARADHRGTRRPDMGRLPARAPDRAARPHPDRHLARGGDPVPRGHRAPRTPAPGPGGIGLGAAAQRRARRPDHVGRRRRAGVRPAAPRRGRLARRYPAAQPGLGRRHAAAARRDPGIWRQRRRGRARLAAAPLGRSADLRARRRHDRPDGLPADRSRGTADRVPADELAAVTVSVSAAVLGGVRRLRRGLRAAQPRTGSRAVKPGSGTARGPVRARLDAV